MYNLTNKQKELLRWLVQQVHENNLPEEFYVSWGDQKGKILEYKGDRNNMPVDITRGALDALVAAQLLLCTNSYIQTLSVHNTPMQYENGRRCTLTGRAYQAVDSNFHEPDTSFVKQLTPLADLTNLDPELKYRCLPILGAGSADPKLWDSAVRVAGVILEHRLRDVGGITNPNRTSRDLVNDVFGSGGTLASKFTVDSERQGHRDIYAGIVGAFRNPYAHRLIDPSPEDGGAFIVFVNLLLKMLEDLR